MTRTKHDKRRHVAALASIALPPDLEDAFTETHLAVLGFIGLEVVSSWRRECTKSVKSIADATGCTRRMVEDAVRNAASQGLIKVTPQIGPDKTRYTNRIAIISPSWRTWLDLPG